MKHKRSRRRPLLASLALAALAAPVLGPWCVSGCAAGFAPISQVDGLRVLAVVADPPYAQPGDQVKFTMTYDDGHPGGPRNVSIRWLGGCFDPAGDEYYGCYPQLASAFADPQNLMTATGTTFTLPLPADIISRRPAPATGPHYGLGIVFFAACAGTIKPILPGDAGAGGAGGSGAAGSFPLGCFDDNGQQLGADSFVPGYAEVYAFADGRKNDNPPVPTFTVSPYVNDDAGAALALDASVPVCPVPEDTRSASGGCGKKDPAKSCDSWQLSVTFPAGATVAEVDPSGMAQGGGAVYETVWIDYFADQGDVNSPVLLVSDATGTMQPSFGTTWIAPPDAGTAHFWAVVHDSRGGEAVTLPYTLDLTP